MTRSFRLGDMTIHRIVEMEAPSADPAYHPFTFFPGLAPELLEENRSWLEPAALDPATGHVVLCFQSYVIRTPHHTVLIDSCIGNHKDRPNRAAWHGKTDGTYMQGLAAAGISVEDVDLVMCTHLHADHVGWNTRLRDGRWVPTFPRARYVFSEREYAYWSERHAAAPIPYMTDSVLPIVEANRAELVRSEHALDDHIRLEPTPGHTPHHFAVRIGQAGRDAVVTGDLIHSPLQARYPELSMRSDYDPELAGRTRRQFLERQCDTDTLVCAAHFPSPSMGRVTRWGEGFRFLPVPPA